MTSSLLLRRDRNLSSNRAGINLMYSLILNLIDVLIGNLYWRMNEICNGLSLARLVDLSRNNILCQRASLNLSFQLAHSVVLLLLIVCEPSHIFKQRACLILACNNVWLISLHLKSGVLSLLLLPILQHCHPLLRLSIKHRLSLWVSVNIVLQAVHQFYNKHLLRIIICILTSWYVRSNLIITMLIGVGGRILRLLVLTSLHLVLTLRLILTLCRSSLKLVLTHNSWLDNMPLLS